MRLLLGVQKVCYRGNSQHTNVSGLAVVNRSEERSSLEKAREHHGTLFMQN